MRVSKFILDKYVNMVRVKTYIISGIMSQHVRLGSTVEKLVTLHNDPIGNRTVCQRTMKRNQGGTIPR